LRVGVRKNDGYCHNDSNGLRSVGGDSIGGHYRSAQAFGFRTEHRQTVTRNSSISLCGDNPPGTALLAIGDCGRATRGDCISGEQSPDLFPTRLRCPIALCGTRPTFNRSRHSLANIALRHCDEMTTSEVEVNEGAVRDRTQYRLCVVRIRTPLGPRQEHSHNSSQDKTSVKNLSSPIKNPRKVAVASPNRAIYLQHSRRTISQMHPGTPSICPVCWDHTVEPMEGVRLSVTINGVCSNIHRIEAFHCSRWHIFIMVQRLDVDGDDTLRPCV
jgi:hypothetical protein